MITDSDAPGIARSDHFDVAVIGGGPLGQAAAYSLGRRGARTLLGGSDGEPGSAEFVGWHYSRCYLAAAPAVEKVGSPPR